MKNIPHYDLHVVQRDKNILDYTSRGARDVIKLQTNVINKATVYVSTPAFLFGGDGNDTLNTAGSVADNVLEGGAGDGMH